MSNISVREQALEFALRQTSWGVTGNPDPQAVVEAAHVYEEYLLGNVKENV